MKQFLVDGHWDACGRTLSRPQRQLQGVQRQLGRMRLAVRQPTMQRLQASDKTAVKPIPDQVGTSVKSTSHSRFGADALKSRFALSGGRAAALSGLVVTNARPRRTPCSPSRRNSRSTWRRDTPDLRRRPRRSCAWTLRTPYSSRPVPARHAQLRCVPGRPRCARRGPTAAGAVRRGRCSGRSAGRAQAGPGRSGSIALLAVSVATADQASRGGRAPPRRDRRGLQRRVGAAQLTVLALQSPQPRPLIRLRTGRTAASTRTC